MSLDGRTQQRLALLESIGRDLRDWLQRQGIDLWGADGGDTGLLAISRVMRKSNPALMRELLSLQVTESDYVWRFAACTFIDQLERPA